MYFFEAGDSLFILRAKNTHFALYYCMKIGDEFAMPQLPEPVVTETAFRERDENLKKADEALVSAGFRREFYRNRMKRTPEDCDVPTFSENVRAADENDFDFARELLLGCFSPLTGCLPDENELHLAVNEGRILLHSRGGLLHYDKTRTGYELRHLCVTEKSRGCGVGGELVRAYDSLLDNKKSVVWVRDGYAPAEKVYEKNGYEKDGMRSSVLIY
ncbi:MAG: GNAT family N-acetyltransferase, partial [Eubacteriales bacterium]